MADTRESPAASPEFLRGSRRYGDLGTHAPPGDWLENTRDHERLWFEVDALRAGFAPTVAFKVLLSHPRAALVESEAVARFEIDREMSGWRLIEARAWCGVPPGVTSVGIAIWNVTQDYDLLDNELWVPIGDNVSPYASESELLLDRQVFDGDIVEVYSVSSDIDARAAGVSLVFGPRTLRRPPSLGPEATLV